MTVVVTDHPLTIDPAGMSRAQLAGEACASCGKSWPRPRVQVGRFPGGGVARCCPECAQAVTG